MQAHVAAVLKEGVDTGLDAQELEKVHTIATEVATQALERFQPPASVRTELLKHVGREELGLVETHKLGAEPLGADGGVSFYPLTYLLTCSHRCEFRVSFSCFTSFTARLLLLVIPNPISLCLSERVGGQIPQNRDRGVEAGTFSL